jgi:LacI family transcriptional regulator
MMQRSKRKRAAPLAPAAAQADAKITIREVARRAGVSTATVSRAFNQPGKVRNATRERILRVIRDTHYVSDGLAGSLVSRRSHTIGLIIPTIMNSIYASSTQAFQRTAQAAGYTILVGISEFSPALEADLIQRLLERRVDGLALTGGTHDRELLEKVRRNGVPVVATWRLTGDPELPAVSFDNYRAATTAVEYLLGLGHRRIGLVCGRTGVNDRALERRRAYEECLQRHGIPVDARLIHERDFEMIDGAAAMALMLALERPPTAVFCANDIQAIGAMGACRDRALEVPRDMSIVGFDDLPITQYTQPKLTTIRVPADDMGRKAADALIAAIAGGMPVASLELPTELILRGSTAPPGTAQATSRSN